jgi:hypothetical protein
MSRPRRLCLEEDCMTAKKQKEKKRRLARKLAEQAWEAAHEDNLDLALKLIRRAVATQRDNPVLWHDQGVLLDRKGEEAKAEQSFRNALRLAPDYAAAYAQLATLQARHGYLHNAVALQEQAVKYDPRSAVHADRLAAYRAQAGTAGVAGPPAPAAESPDPTPAPSAEDPPGDGWAERLAELDWPALGDRLTREGCGWIPGLLASETCAALCGLFDDDERFARTVVMDRPQFGQGVYRYFRPPLPTVVDRLRRGIYPYLARIANDWQHRLNEAERYPEEWEGFHRVCQAAGQSVPTPLLLKYGPGGFNALHRDLRGLVFFPLQLAVVLSPRADPSDPNAAGFQGGEFLLCDVPERAKSARRVVPAGLGDAVLFCTRDRLVRVGGAYGLQPVKHGVAPITAGTRFVLGVPFHDYR